MLPHLAYTGHVVFQSCNEIAKNPLRSHKLMHILHPLQVERLDYTPDLLSKEVVDGGKEKYLVVQ